MPRILRDCRETSSVHTPHRIHKSAHSLVVFGSRPVFKRATSVHRVGTHPVDGFFDILRRQAAGEIELRNDLADFLCHSPVNSFRRCFSLEACRLRMSKKPSTGCVPTRWTL